MLKKKMIAFQMHRECRVERDFSDFFVHPSVFFFCLFVSCFLFVSFSVLEQM